MKAPQPIACTPVRPKRGRRAMTSVACLDRIYRTVNEEGFTPETKARLKKEYQLIHERYGVADEAAALLAAVLERTPTSHPFDDEGLARYLGCSNIEFLAFTEKLSHMENHGLLHIGMPPRGVPCYTATAALLRSVEKDEPFTPERLSGLTEEELLGKMHSLIEDWRMDSLDSTRLSEELERLIRLNRQLPFCQKIIASPLFSECDSTDRVLFFLLADGLVSEGTTSEEIGLLGCLGKNPGECMHLRRQLSRGARPIQRHGLVEFACDDGFNNSDFLTLTDKARETFFPDMAPPSPKAVTHKDMIPPAAIAEKELFFNREESRSLSRLEALLQDDAFRSVQSRLTSAGMRRGFNVLFHGAPGTGKTECVMQLGRRSGRAVFPVNMSQLRSKWVGESERTVKSLFDLYRRICETNPVAPILLFNEADAIFAKRLENVEHSSDQMNNTLQNIILQEMESIEGILIATTNLPGALDEAFERRFIYKVAFSLPDSATRGRIWRSMLPSLSEADASLLGGRYPFSGGNIENIARKSMVEFILSGKQPSLETLDEFCADERLGDAPGQKKIGF